LFEVALRLDRTGAFVSSDVTDKTHSLASRNRFDETRRPDEQVFIIDLKRRSQLPWRPAELRR